MLNLRVFVYTADFTIRLTLILYIVHLHQAFKRIKFQGSSICQYTPKTEQDETNAGTMVDLDMAGKAQYGYESMPIGLSDLSVHFCLA